MATKKKKSAPRRRKEVIEVVYDDPQAARIAALKARDPRELTGAEKRELAEAKALEAAAGPASIVLDDGDETPLHLRDPRSMTGQQKQMLSGAPRFLKPQPRGARTPDGRDPRSLTGAEKKQLGAQKRAAAAARPVAPGPVVGALSDAERQELSMLRMQGAIPGVPDLAAFEGDELAALERFELARRRKHVPAKRTA
jgi:hypothetical protein